MTHICIGELTFIGPDNGLSPGRRQAIIWTNAGILLIGPLGTNFSEILIAIEIFSFKKMHLKISSGRWRPFCLGLNVLKPLNTTTKPQQTTTKLYAYLIQYAIYAFTMIKTFKIIACMGTKCFVPQQNIIHHCQYTHASLKSNTSSEGLAAANFMITANNIPENLWSSFKKSNYPLLVSWFTAWHEIYLTKHEPCSRSLRGLVVFYWNDDIPYWTK